MEIPQYPESRPLAMTDKAILDQFCTDLQPRVSELTFAGLYLFRKAHEYKISMVKDSIIIRGKGYDGSFYFMPPLGGNISKALEIILLSGLPLYGADDLFIDRYLNRESVQITELRDSFDYLYLRDELATLPGRHFHKKKNRIGYFTKHHDHSVHILSREHLNGCLGLLDKILKSSRDEVENSLVMEMDATAEAVQSFTELGLEGVVITINDDVAAFAIGERLNPETAVCHFEKADPFIEGLYQLVNREFAQLLFQECRYLNREQDLGNAGLRSAKLSYHPVELVKKYSVTCPDYNKFVAL